MRPPEAPGLPGGGARWPGPEGPAARWRGRRGAAAGDSHRPFALRVLPAGPSEPKPGLRARAKRRRGLGAREMGPRSHQTVAVAVLLRVEPKPREGVAHACAVLTPERWSAGAFRNGKRRPAPSSHFGRVPASPGLGFLSGPREESRPELEGRSGLRPGCATEPHRLGHVGSAHPSLLGRRTRLENPGRRPEVAEAAPRAVKWSKPACGCLGTREPLPPPSANSRIGNLQEMRVWKSRGRKSAFTPFMPRPRGPLQTFPLV